jgi:sterol 3beta-glucosyltransferase
LWREFSPLKIALHIWLRICYNPRVRILLLTYGSRGDVQPFLALAVGLQQAGHSVRLALPACLEELAQPYAILTLPLPGDPSALSEELNRSSHNLVRQILAIQSHVLPLAQQVGSLAYEGIQECDLVVHSFLFAAGAHTFAQQRGIPDISAQFFPIFAPTRSMPAVGFPEPSLPGRYQGAYNLATHRLSKVLFHGLSARGYPVVRKHYPRWPRQLLWPFDAAAGHPPSPLLLGISPQILPPAPEWHNSHIHVTGYWVFEEDGYQPPAALSSFLAGGEPPVCVGFGSMIHPRSTIIQRTLLTALRSEKQRAIILTGWDGWESVRAELQGPDFLFIEGAPHAWLLPRCKLAIHHGGAGTTAAALRAGVPQWIIPFTADQPFWARRIHQIGAGPSPIKPEEISPGKLAPLLRAALETAGWRARAAEVGEKIRRENGVARAVEIISRHVRS